MHGWITQLLLLVLLAKSGTSSEVKFSYVRDTSLVVIPVLVNDRGPYRFLLDTGASHSILSNVLADKLKIQSGRIEDLVTAGGRVPVSIRTLEVFQMGDVRITRTEIAVADFGLLGVLQIDGILGGDYLRRFKISIDYSDQIVRIEGRR